MYFLDDSWINISPEQLDEMLNNAYGKATSPATDFNKVAERMKEFVDNMSSHEGAEFPGCVILLICCLESSYIALLSERRKVLNVRILQQQIVYD
jgi:SGT1 protein